jgi:hypothetical protein
MPDVHLPARRFPQFGDSMARFGLPFARSAAQRRLGICAFSRPIFVFANYIRSNLSKQLSFVLDEIAGNSGQSLTRP